MSDALVKYNDKIVPVSGTGPTPFVSQSYEVLIYGNRWGTADKIVLNGQITGADYSALYTAQTGLVDIFSNQFKNLDIYESADDANSYSKVYSFSGCYLQNLSFGNAGYNKVVDYSIELLSYPSGLTGYFSGTYGIIDPKDEMKISEGEDGFATLTRNISAKAFVTTTIDDAINNAKTFVSARTGISNVITTPQISGFQNSANFTPVLTRMSENLDRLSLTYSVDQTYRFHMLTGDAVANNNYSFNNYYLTSYSTNLTSGAGEDFVAASIQGEIKAGITGVTGDALISGLLNQLSGLNPYAVISNKYGAPNNLSFCQDPIDFKVTQDLKARKINFSASYDNLDFYGLSNNKYVYSGCFLDSVITHSIDELTQTATISIRGDIKCRGSASNRLSNASVYLGKIMTDGSSATEPRLYDFVNDYYTGYLATASPVLALGTKPINVKVDTNTTLGTISIEAEFDNKDKFSSLNYSEYTVDYTPYNTIFAYASSCNDAVKHIAVDINVKKREKVDINLVLGASGKSELELISVARTLLEPDTANSFYNLFPLSLSETNSIQEDSSVLSTQNSSAGNALTSNKYGSSISMSKSYSYELKDSEAGTRRIIKSASNIGTV
jgi:hypothetical protein